WRHRGSQGTLCTRRGLRDNHAGPDHRDDRHVVLAVRGGVAGPGFVTLNRNPQKPKLPGGWVLFFGTLGLIVGEHRLRRTTLTGYVPESYSHRWLPEDIELKTWEQIEPWYRRLMDQPVNSAAD